ncbi:hypothetical protein SNE40_008679 [Patella caerulea]|uniref:Uncharacterized protein n=1 Tax=Patella caerulea TaxID=87958 RepID=A0AAN8PNX1_PATCE
MLKGLTEQELDVIRWQNKQLRRHFKDTIYKENISRDLETYQPGFYFVSDKNQKGEHETLHCTAIVVVPPGGKPTYFDSHGNVPDDLRDRVAWSQLKLQKNVKTCTFHCLYVFDMWTKQSLVESLGQYSRQTFKEFMDGLYSPEQGYFDPDIHVMLHFKEHLLPALRKYINDTHVEVNLHPN